MRRYSAFEASLMGARVSLWRKEQQSTAARDMVREAWTRSLMRTWAEAALAASRMWHREA